MARMRLWLVTLAVAALCIGALFFPDVTVGQMLRSALG